MLCLKRNENRAWSQVRQVRQQPKVDFCPFWEVLSPKYFGQIVLNKDTERYKCGSIKEYQQTKRITSSYSYLASLENTLLKLLSNTFMQIDLRQTWKKRPLFFFSVYLNEIRF